MLILVVTIFSTVFNVLQPLPMKVLVDQVFEQKPISESLALLLGWLSWDVTLHGLLFWVALSGLLIFFVNSLLDIALTFLWIRVGQKMVYDLMRDLFSHVQRSSLLFHYRNSVGDLLSRITGDTWAIYTVTDAVLFTPLLSLLMIAAMIIVMVQINIEMTLISLAVAPLMAITSLFFGKRIRKIAHHKRKSESLIQSHVQQTLAGLVVIQSFSQEEQESGRFRALANAAISAQKRGTLTGSFYNLLSGGFNSLGAGAILYVGSLYVISNQISIGSLLVFVVYLSTLQGRFKTLIGLYSTLQTARAGIDRVVEILDTDKEVEDCPGAKNLEQVRGHIRFENVSFGYQSASPILKDVSFEASPGQTIAVVGLSGAGKSTLVSLIPRFFDAWEGKVLIDDVDVRDVKLDSLRRQVGLVLQEPFLFPVTVAENISYGRSGATREEIESAARAANADEFIRRLPEGYETIVGERGSSLSGGERQRISIARALLKDAPILILDEPTSALDVETEKSVLEALERLMQGRTTLIIAHRLSTVRKADRIVVIKNGMIAEQGSHPELIASNGLYSFLCQIQLGEWKSRVK